MILKLIKKLLTRTSYQDENLLRRAHILETLLTGLILFTSIGIIRWIHAYFFSPIINRNAAPFGVLLGLWLVVAFLFIVSRKGYPLIAARIIIGLLFMAVFQLAFTWGIDVMQSVAMFALIIVLSGILISDFSALATYLLVGVTMFGIHYGQSNGLIELDADWKTVPAGMFDVFVLYTTYGVITLVSWLSSREISRSINKAKASANEAKSLAKTLKQERDQLEEVVEKRTRSLRQAQLEKMQQMYSTVEIGRTAAGLIHDINNPLSVILLNIHTIQENLEVNSSRELADALKKTTLASKKIQALIRATKKQLHHSSDPTKFKAIKEIKQISLLYKHRLEQSSITFTINSPSEIVLYTHQAHFAQVIANLLSNAIDALETTSKKNKSLTITVLQQQSSIIIEVTDNGHGISKYHQKKVFEPLFSTKSKAGGVGLGLYISKKIVEDLLRGSIFLNSNRGKGTTFTIKLPLKAINE